MSWTSVGPFQCDQSHTLCQKLVLWIWLCLVCCCSLKESIFSRHKNYVVCPRSRLPICQDFSGDFKVAQYRLYISVLFLRGGEHSLHEQQQ
jgi:hypothetical protein